ncbi:MAG: HlyD family type I secretion periplasmic adaptor subunit [Rhodospirillales bacterium]|nr:HlyD family type I secretion periplasmic adaptor subunit [Rhodospirillales bacterium]
MTSEVQALPGPRPRPRPRRAADPRPILLHGLLVVAITFGGFGLWSAITPLARGAHVVGKVVVDTNRKTVQHLEGGIVKEILVREGSRVEAGDVLVRLDTTQALANRDILRQRLVRERILEARLAAERDGASAVVLPEELRDAVERPEVRAAFADQQALFAARRKEFESEITILSERVTQLRHQIRGMQAEQVANREQFRLINEELDGLRELADKGFASTNRVRAMEREAARLEGDHASRVAEIARAEVAVGEAQLQVVQTRQQFVRGVLDELRQVRGQIGELEEQLRATEDVLTRTVIRAPLSGQVVGLAVHTIGGVIDRGQVVLHIVPEDERLIVEAQVRPLDADVVHPGLHAEIRFMGLPRKSSPLLKGEVSTISQDTLNDPQTGDYYLARIEVADDELARLGDVTVVPGMPVEVLIAAGERTPLDYLVSPWLDLFERAMRED